MQTWLVTMKDQSMWWSAGSLMRINSDPAIGFDRLEFGGIKPRMFGRDQFILRDYYPLLNVKSITPVSGEGSHE